MHFLMEAFERILSNYGYRYAFSYDKKTNTYHLNLLNLPTDLDYKFLVLEYDIESETRIVNDERGKPVIYSTPNSAAVCRPMRVGSSRIIHIDFNSNDYAKKINKIESLLRQYESDKK